MVTVGLRENLGRIVILDSTVAYFLCGLSSFFYNLMPFHVLRHAIINAIFTPVLIQL